MYEARARAAEISADSSTSEVKPLFARCWLIKVTTRPSSPDENELWLKAATRTELTTPSRSAAQTASLTSLVRGTRTARTFAGRECRRTLAVRDIGSWSLRLRDELGRCPIPTNLRTAPPPHRGPKVPRRPSVGTTTP